MSPDWPVLESPPIASRTRGKALVYVIMLVLVLGLLACGGFVAVYVIPQFGAARALSQQTKTESQIRAIGVALDSYHARYQQFPLAYTVDASGTPLLSWRVALLPFLGEQKLHQKFDLSKPWDSAVNRPWIDQMPSVYRAAYSRAGNAQRETSFVTLRDPSSVFPGDKPISLADCQREYALTIAVVVAPQLAVDWTKPEDISVADFSRVLQASSDQPPQPMAVMLDGVVQKLGPAVAPQMIEQQVSRTENVLAE